MHIVFVDNYISHTLGGIPRTTSTIANAMQERGHQVTIFTEDTLTRKSVYMLHKDICLKFYEFSDLWTDINDTRMQLQFLNPDVCCPMFGDARQLVWAVTILGTGIPYLYTERCGPSAVEQEFWSRKGRLAAMSGADRIQLLLPAFENTIPDFLRPRVRVIPNAAPPVSEKAHVEGRIGERKILLWVARLDDDIKQCRVALDAFALLSRDYAEWDMHIIGAGKDSALIQDHAKRRLPSGRVMLHGTKHDVTPYYLKSHVFCISSRTEGFPNTLIEAMACGLPAVGFAACEGVRDIIASGTTGLLAGEMTAESLASSLALLMRSPELRVEMGEHARQFCATLREDTIIDAWEALLCETAACKGATVMDSFDEEPFASRARLSAAARRQRVFKDFTVQKKGRDS